jgi:cytochrome b subunit of formate dehydrogenase
MERPKLKFWVDLIMFIDFLVLAISGFVLKWAVPRGAGKLGASFIFIREVWLSIHNVTAVLIVIFILIHLLLNWVWIKNMFLCSLGKNKKEECELESKNGKNKSKPRK